MPLARALAALLLLAVTPAVFGQIPHPNDFAGFEIGSDGNLLRWERIVDYIETVAAASDRVLIEELGKTHNGNPFIVATISSPTNLTRLDEIRETQWRVAHPQALSEQEIEDIAWSSPAVVMITGNIHATEIAASQMAVEIIHELATDDSRWTANVLENVVFLFVPSFNPDGQVMVTDWNNRVRGTENVWSSLPWLYHPYVGHDNNRDAYMMTQPESRYVNKLLFQEWFPQIYLDEHQQNNDGMRVFVPPFRNPINPNVDPAVWAAAGRIGFAMYQQLHEAGFTGVGYDQKYTAWWQGGFLRGAWFHNMVGLLTEVASANLASPVVQAEAELGKPQPNGKSRGDWYDEREDDPEAPMPAPRDVMPRYDYPRPWLGGRWTLRNVIDAELAITRATLETAANERVRLIRTQIRMGLDAVDQGRLGSPRAYVIPSGQRDPGAVYTLTEALHYAGVEVQRAQSEIRAGGETFPEGSYVISMAQPFRAYAKDLLEPQEHPDPRDMPAGKMGDQPYDLTAWTLPIQMGVEATAVDSDVKGALDLLKRIPRPKTSVASGDGSGWLIDSRSNQASTAVNRLLREGVRLGRLKETADGREAWGAGSVWIPKLSRERLEELLGDLGLTVVATDADPSQVQPLRAVRTALYRPWTASMDEGWTRWLLEEYEFPFTPLFDADMREGELREDWDVLLLPGDRGTSRLVKGNDRKSTHKEFRDGLGDSGRKAIREFVAAGGTLVVWGDAVEFALDTFELPLRDAIERTPGSQFSCPGSFLRIQTDPDHPVAYGMPQSASALFKNDAALEPLPGFSFTDYKVIARYPGSDLLESGWMRGEEHLAHRIAAAEARYRKGGSSSSPFGRSFEPSPTRRSSWCSIRFTRQG